VTWLFKIASLLNARTKNVIVRIARPARTVPRVLACVVRDFRVEKVEIDMKLLKTIMLALAMTVMTLAATFGIILLIALMLKCAVWMDGLGLVLLVAAFFFAMFTYKINQNLSNGRPWYDLN